ncbi:MAG: GAF domain-containing protein [Halodesulfurarchaeum sp.]
MDRRVVGVTLLALAAGLLVAIVGLAPANLANALVGTGPFLLIAVALGFTGGWVVRGGDPFEAHADRVLYWTVGGAASFASVGQLLLLGAADMGTVWAVRSLVESFAAGALAGALVGVYDARSRHRHAALQAERDRVERFARKAESLNTYGKALNESRDVHEVSALSIEVLELLIESSESAVLLGSTDSTRILDTTVPERWTDFLKCVARDAIGSASMEAVRCPGAIDCEIPAEMDVSEVIAVPIEVGDTALVLLALARDGTVYSAEDLDLLEALSAHVGTAVRDLDTDLDRS